MTRWISIAVAALVLLLALSACGGSGSYAGLSKDDARSLAWDGFGQWLKQQADVSQLFLGGKRSDYLGADWRKHVQVGELSKQKNSVGIKAWLVTFYGKGSEDDGSRVCVWVWENENGGRWEAKEC